MTFTTVTAMGDEETFSTIERAKDVAQAIADRSGKRVDVVDDATETVVFVAEPS